MLAVKGKVICEEVKVALYPWADYVFDADYKLPTIDSLEAYIKENKHLPNINSAKEVEAEGLSLGEMQNKQMEKIEELTLYLIQQHKEIEALKNELKAMKQN
jgi:hypothetical protein